MPAEPDAPIERQDGMIHHAQLASLGLAIVFIAAACTAGPGAGPPESVVGRQFLSTGVTVNGAERPLVEGTRIRLSFTDRAISASAGCNSIGGTYTIAAGQLLVADLAMTEMGCDAPRHEQDAWLAAFLGARPTLRLSGNELTLEADGTVVRLLDREVAEPDLPLVGTVWTLVTIIDGEVASSVPVMPAPTLAFGDDGQLTLHTGCNSGFGTYVAEGTTLRLSAIGTTKMACPGAGDETERAVLAVLNAGTVTFQIDASTLRLTAGVLGLEYAGAAEPAK